MTRVHRVCVTSRNGNWLSTKLTAVEIATENGRQLKVQNAHVVNSLTTRLCFLDSAQKLKAHWKNAHTPKPPGPGMMVWRLQQEMCKSNVFRGRDNPLKRVLVSRLWVVRWSSVLVEIEPGSERQTAPHARPITARPARSNTGLLLNDMPEVPKACSASKAAHRAPSTSCFMISSSTKHARAGG